ncbi:MAG: isoprenyl transferase [Rhodothalassiaceae bacterium]|nr:MAG: isoprenyl transferase [Rhodothalassiaceae bacterium]
MPGAETSASADAVAHAGGSGAIPRHVAIIMDGNGRWAARRGLPRAAGHRAGAEAVREAVKAAADLGVEALTLYAFSSENWKRPADEVRDLMGLLRIYLRREMRALHEENVRIRFIGEHEGLAEDIRALMAEARTLTAANTGLNLVLAINYGARREIVLAARRLAAAVARGEIAPEDIDETRFAAALFLPDLPDPDLVIRTSGEQRLSNFLLWQAAYAELLFLDILWPDFTQATFREAVAEYARRERRFGGR